jgi:pimeloyl-ACP methyl ester carboxylesterase
MAAGVAPTEFTVMHDGSRLLGESLGEGPPVVLLHGLTATRRYVVHGSRALARAGHRQITYDARGHGRSDPAAPGHRYSYGELAGDLEAVANTVVGEGPFVLAGHSMGAHTALAYALDNASRLAALVIIGPTYVGVIDDESIAAWDRLADGFASGGVEGFMTAYDHDLRPEWREAVLRIARRRMGEHRHPEAVADAIRAIARSRPYDGLSELELVDVPALVVASHDAADPGHPYSVASAYAQALPHARLISEREGESPLAWQGGRLAREIAGFCEEPEVRRREAAGRGTYPGER